jgi:hypothetical protein
MVSHEIKRFTSLQTSHKDLETMTRIVLDVQEDISKTVVDMLQLCSGVEIVNVGEEELASEEQVAACVAQAIAELRADKIAFRSYDFTWILVAMNQYVVEDIEGFRSPQAFVDYLRLAGVEELPFRTSLHINNVEGIFPDWQFVDTEEPQEVLRRINIVKRFLSAYRRAKRAL